MSYPVNLVMIHVTNSIYMSPTLWTCHQLYGHVTNSVGAERMQAPELVCDSSYCHELHRNVRTLSKYQELYLNVTKSI